MALWCSGGAFFKALGLTVEQSTAAFPGTLGYGSWAAQAQELARAMKGGGEHPNCPAATVRAETQNPCIDIVVGKNPNAAFKRICDQDCKGLRLRSGKGSSTEPGGLPCGLKFRYPALYPGPDSVPGGAQYGQFYGAAPRELWGYKSKWTANYYWRCKFAGYKDTLGHPQYGMDDDDKGYFSRQQNLLHTSVFGKDVCTEFRGDFCGSQDDAGRDVFQELMRRRVKGVLKLPGCRTDGAPSLTCSTTTDTGKGMQCLCEDKNKAPDEPNAFKLGGFGPGFGVDTCGSKEERKQPAFECFGPLLHLAPGESMRYGFRCKTDEKGIPPWGRLKLQQQKLWCPKGAQDAPGMCSSSSWMIKEAHVWPLWGGRFSPGDGPVKACVRLGVVCNGECNCQDCSDEADCANRPLVVGSSYDQIGWSTPESKLRCRRAGDGPMKDLPENVLDCEREGITLQ